MPDRGEKGYECVLTADVETLGIVRDVTVDRSADEINITSRDSSGWKEFLQGLKEWGLDIDSLWVPTNTALQALNTAFDSGATVAISVLDEDGFGWTGNCIVTAFPRVEPLADAVTATITLKGTGAATYVSGS